MKKYTLLMIALCVISIVGIYYNSLRAVDYIPKRRVPIDILVAASNAMAHEKAAADYTCDGADDNVQIQAALDVVAASANEGGVVRLSTGTFYVDAASGQTATSGTAGEITGGAATSTIDLDDAAGDEDNFSVGDLIYISAGDDDTGAGVGETLEDQEADGVYTVTNIAGEVLTINARLGNGNNFEDVSYERVPYSIKLPNTCTLEGAGVTDATKIITETNANCSVIACLPASGVAHEARIRSLFIDGNHGNQSGTGAICNGVATNKFAGDVHITDVTVLECKGDGFVFSTGWGVVLDGKTYVELCEGNGVTTGSDIAICNGVKLVANTGHGLMLNNRAAHCRVHGGIYAGGAGKYGIYIRGGYDNMFVGCYLQCQNNTEDGGIKLTEFMDLNSQYNTFSSLSIYLDGTGIGVSLSSLTNGNSFLGTAIRGVDSIFYSDAGWGNQFIGSVLAPETKGIESNDKQCRSVIQNTGIIVWDGYVVSWKPGTTAGYEVQLPTTAADDDPLYAGVVSGSISNGLRGWIQTTGIAEARVDGVTAGAVAAGDYLTTQDYDAEAGVQGYFVEAASGEQVRAIAMEAQASKGNVTVYLLPETFIAP